MRFTVVLTLGDFSKYMVTFFVIDCHFILVLCFLSEYHLFIFISETEEKLWLES